MPISKEQFEKLLESGYNDDVHNRYLSLILLLLRATEYYNLELLDYLKEYNLGTLDIKRDSNQISKQLDRLSKKITPNVDRKINNKIHFMEDFESLRKALDNFLGDIDALKNNDAVLYCLNLTSKNSDIQIKADAIVGINKREKYDHVVTSYIFDNIYKLKQYFLKEDSGFILEGLEITH